MAQAIEELKNNNKMEEISQPNISDYSVATVIHILWCGIDEGIDIQVNGTK